MSKNDLAWCLDKSENAWEFIGWNLPTEYCVREAQRVLEATKDNLSYYLRIRVQGLIVAKFSMDKLNELRIQTVGSYKTDEGCRFLSCFINIMKDSK